MIAQAECRKFERKMSDIEKNAQQGENVDTHPRESLLNIIKDQF